MPLNNLHRKILASFSNEKANKEDWDNFQGKK